MPNQTSTSPEAIDRRFESFQSQLDQLRSENQEQRNIIAYLADQVDGEGVLEKIERDRHVSTLEAIIVREFDLHSAQDMYWNPEHNISYRNRKGDKASQFDSRRYVHRTAQVTVYYLLTQHCQQISMRWLEDHYGYCRAHVPVTMSRLVQNKDYSKLLASVERQYLDAIGRTDEPTTTLQEDSFIVASHLKQLCQKRGIDYRRSLPLLD